MRPLSNVIGIDDAPFQRSHRGNVGLVGAIFTRHRLDGVVLGQVRRDGSEIRLADVSTTADARITASVWTSM